ncbi:MAG: hypothetical protein IH991_18155 [Planctomycetes bacterium]|nr:hypothetical protein [Planctomycetota bacterium]
MVEVNELGSTDLNGNGRRILVGLRVDPKTRKGVWAGFYTLGNTPYAGISDGEVPAGEANIQKPFDYRKTGTKYRLSLELLGSRARLTVSDGAGEKLTIEAGDIDHLSAGKAGIWITGPPSNGKAISMIVDDWSVEGR